MSATQNVADVLLARAIQMPSSHGGGLVREWTNGLTTIDGKQEDLSKGCVSHARKVSRWNWRAR